MNIFIDILFTIATLGFILSDIRQLTKLRKTQHVTNAISRSHLKLKVFSLICVIVAYQLSGLHISLCVSSIQLILNIGIIAYVYKGRENHA